MPMVPSSAGVIEDARSSPSWTKVTGMSSVRSVASRAARMSVQDPHASPSTEVMASPAAMPASCAGEPSATAPMTLVSTATVTPMTE